MKGSCDICGFKGHMVDNPHEYFESMCKNVI